ncbi:unnamed protein product [Lactuca virosa]|uniref:Importin N-terminal domain-containing protein n=1 Tax=Lactuca virosa TaxID=75947 RepID=A0AAU9PW94_9ASTR|nr:unnamed protein product [Lactuca virosa]
MELTSQVAQLFNNTLSPDGEVRRSASDALDRLSPNPDFSFALISIAVGGGENQGQSIAAATYLKNFTRRNTIQGETASRVNKEFRDRLVLALLQAEPAILKVLIEAFRPIVDAEFVKQNLWDELVPQLRSVIQDSDLVNRSGNSRWKTINSLTVLQSVIRPFQYFLNPKIAKEAVPPQLEIIAQEILIHLISLFHLYVEDLCVQNKVNMDAEKSLLIMSKCIYYAVRSHMPSALVPLLPSLCHDLIRILHSLKFEDCDSSEDGYMLRLKTGKRSLLIFCALITRHRKFSDKLMPDIINSAVKLVKFKTDFSKLDNLGERVMSLAFDVISRLLETGPGWRLVSPHFSSLLESAIFPAIVMNEKDITEWEEDSDEYIRKNLPSELEEISGLREDLFTPRKSALNLLGVISISKGPPVAASLTSKRKKGEKNKQKGRSSMGELLVLPFLSKFPIPSHTNTPVRKTTNDYYGVLMAYGNLVDFLKEQKPAYTTTLIRSRVLPLYNASSCDPYLVASANWILGELVSCIPEEMSSDVYTSLLKALTMEDTEDISCYPVRVSAAGAIAQLVENEFLPPEWLPILQVVVGRIRESNDEETESAIMFEVLKTLVEAGGDAVVPHIPHIISLLAQHILNHIPLSPEPWPQVVARGFAALSVMGQCWEESFPGGVADDAQSDVVVSGRATIDKAFTDLLQQAWLRPMEDEITESPSPSSCCMDDSSTLLVFIMSNLNECDEIQNEKVTNLLHAWAHQISNWSSWEEEEDLSIFKCIKEAAHLHRGITVANFIRRSTGGQPSIIENIAFDCFREQQSKPSPLWKPLLLAICTCYSCYPDVVENTLEKDQDEGFKMWARALCSISSTEFEHGLTTENEIKLTVLTLAKMITRMITGGNDGGGLLSECLAAMMEACVRLKEAQEEDEDNDENEDENNTDDDTEDDEDDDDDEDSEDDAVHEETEEQFLERCAQAAIEMENGTNLEEIEEEDEEQEIEMGELDEVDALSIVKSLIESNREIVLQRTDLPQQVVSSFVDAFPGLLFSK